MNIKTLRVPGVASSRSIPQKLLGGASILPGPIYGDSGRVGAQPNNKSPDLKFYYPVHKIIDQVIQNRTMHLQTPDFFCFFL